MKLIVNRRSSKSLLFAILKTSLRTRTVFRSRILEPVCITKAYRAPGPWPNTAWSKTTDSDFLREITLLTYLLFINNLYFFFNHNLSLNFRPRQVADHRGVSLALEELLNLPELVWPWPTLPELVQVFQRRIKKQIVILSKCYQSLLDLARACQSLPELGPPCQTLPDLARPCPS